MIYDNKEHQASLYSYLWSTPGWFPDAQDACLQDAQDAFLKGPNWTQVKNFSSRLIVWFQKLSIPPPGMGFFPRSPPPPFHLSGNSSQASYIYINFWAFENPPTPRNFQSFPWGEYGYFPELHILNFLCLLALVIHELGLGDKGNWEST